MKETSMKTNITTVSFLVLIVVVLLVGMFGGNLTWTFEEESAKVRPLVEELTKGCETEVCKAKALYLYVRDEIKFGFTAEFDTASPSYTAFVAKKGHCNPKASLFVTMLRTAGIKARLHVVPIYLSPLIFFRKGMLSDRLETPGIHTFTEMQYSGTDQWIPVDGYVVDSDLFRNSQHYLQEENGTVGYFTIRDAKTSIEWDGLTSAMSQYIDNRIDAREYGKEEVLEIEQLRQYYRSHEYPLFHRIAFRLPNSLPLVSKLKELLFSELNSCITAVRNKSF